MAIRAVANRLPLYRALYSSSSSSSSLRILCSPRQFPYGIRCHSAVNANAKTKTKSSSSVVIDGNKESSSWKIKMLYDGDCPLCMREVNMLKERDSRYGAIKFVDISSEDYSAVENEGLDYETVMGRIHAILSDGTVLRDVEIKFEWRGKIESCETREAFRGLYEAVGLGWVYAITKYEPIATIANAVYSVWAKYRLQITGRPPLDNILEARKRKDSACNDDKACRM